LFADVNQIFLGFLKIRIISKRVGDPKRIQEFKDSRGKKKSELILHNALADKNAYLSRNMRGSLK
jgi:hypothetical protein